MPPDDSPPTTLNVLVENESTLGPVFEIDRVRFAAARTRHPGIGDHISVIFSTDCDRFDSAIGEADVLIGWTFPHRKLAAVAPRLRWVHLTGAGVNHLAPFDWVPERVVVTNNRGVHASKAEEFGALSALMIVNCLPQIVGQQGRHEWSTLYSRSIVGMTAGIVGVGNMGGAVATGCKMLGMTVIGTRRGGAPHPQVDRMFGPDGLDTLLVESDVLFLCTPLTVETRKLIGPRQLARMKKGAGLVNIARGGVLDHDALCAALDRGHLSGAVLDVFDQEPLPAASPLWAAPNVVITPHCSSDDAAAYIPKTLDLIFDNLGRLMAGQPLIATFDRDLGY